MHSAGFSLPPLLQSRLWIWKSLMYSFRKKKTFKAIFISTTISYLINNRCLIKCKLVLYPLLYLLNLLLTVFTKFVSFGSKAFCKLFINSKLKWRQFFYVKAPALAVSNRVLQWALCSPCPYAKCPCHLETPQTDFWLWCNAPPKSRLSPLLCVTEIRSWLWVGLSRFCKEGALSRAIMGSLQWPQPWARGFTGTQYICDSWLRRAPWKAHLFQQASHNQTGCLATQCQIMDIWIFL